MTRLKRAFAAAGMACALTGGVAAQQDGHAGWFPFVIPDLADEETAGTPIDLSFLNPEPAGSRGFLRPDGERIVDGRGEEVRLSAPISATSIPCRPKRTRRSWRGD
jgi:hypothetical protein